MLHACVQRFDVTGNLEKFCKILGTKQALGPQKISRTVFPIFKKSKARCLAPLPR